MAIESTPLLYTTEAEVVEIFGQYAVDLRIDDDDDLVRATPESNALTSIIIEATDIANEYLLHYYTDVQLETSLWVHRRVAYIAAHLLSRRRGNPGQYIDEYDKAIADFDRVRSGVDFIPRLQTHSNFEPAVSNQVVDYRYARSKLRTDPVTSGDIGEGRPIDWWDYYIDYVY